MLIAGVVIGIVGASGNSNNETVAGLPAVSNTTESQESATTESAAQVTDDIPYVDDDADEDPEYVETTEADQGVITYVVTGSNGAKRAMLTYATASGTTQESNVRLPFKKKVKDVDFYYISAQNSGSGTIKCQVVQDGEPLAENVTKGSYAIAACSA